MLPASLCGGGGYSGWAPINKFGVKKQTKNSVQGEGGGGLKNGKTTTTKKNSVLYIERKKSVLMNTTCLNNISPHQNYQKSVENFCWINYIRNLEPNCQYSCSSCSSSSQDCSQIYASPSKSLHGLSKHLPVFLLGTQNVVVGGWQ